MLKQIDRNKTMQALKNRLAAIEFESEEDEGAAEYYGEVDSVIQVLTANKSDEAIIDAAILVGLDSDVKYV